MSFEIAVQTAIYNKLTGTAAVTSITPRIYDSVPQDTTFPYITIGEDIHSENDSDTTLGSDVTVTINSWSRKRGRKEVKQIQGAIYDALQRATDLTYSGYRFITIDFAGSQSFMDADGLTRHGVQTFRVLIERI